MLNKEDLKTLQTLVLSKSVSVGETAEKATDEAGKKMLKNFRLELVLLHDKLKTMETLVTN